MGQLEYQKVIDYISNQKEHHKIISFQEEYLQFLKAYGIKYEEKYLWELRVGLFRPNFLFTIPQPYVSQSQAPRTRAGL